MILTIKANGGINKVNTIKINGKVEQVDIDFNDDKIWSGLELWLENEKKEFCDYIALNITKRNKLKAHK